MSTIKNGQMLLLELVSSLQHWANHMLEMFVIQQTSIQKFLFDST